jgi:hypothetical protein
MSGFVDWPVCFYASVNLRTSILFAYYFLKYRRSGKLNEKSTFGAFFVFGG